MGMTQPCSLVKSKRSGQGISPQDINYVSYKDHTPTDAAPYLALTRYPSIFIVSDQIIPGFVHTMVGFMCTVRDFCQIGRKGMSSFRD